MRIIPRPAYLDWLVRHRDRQAVRILTGPRGSGKSTILALFREHLLARSAAPEQLVTIDCEEVTELFRPPDAKDLLGRVLSRLQPDRETHVFLDEPQRVPGFTDVCAALLAHGGCRLYLACSGAGPLSGEGGANAAESLRGPDGPPLERLVLPLSFAEFCAGLVPERKSLPLRDKFALYLAAGSMPWTARLDADREQARELLEGNYLAILVRDMGAPRINRRYLDAVARRLLLGIGRRTSPAALARDAPPRCGPMDPKTAAGGLRLLLQSRLFFEARRFSLKSGTLLRTQSRYYAFDTALRAAVVGERPGDFDRVLANVVFLELVRRGCAVHSGGCSIPAREADFIALRDGAPSCWQVRAAVSGPEELSRTIAPLRGIRMPCPKWLLTYDTVPGRKLPGGIQERNILDWLLDEGASV
ncbi:MAG: AAA family ATPase [Desulfovibrionaceae bacterium]|nr:AAA family ATPase [Desulfovibrionaceae bacterium]